MTKLQAHRGVCTEYPENTMSAFHGAIAQGYPIIELDPNVTADDVFVILHDKEINRTARNTDGSPIPETISITDITYAEAKGYDYGSWFSEKFKREPLPLLSEALDLAAKHDILVKIDNKFKHFPEPVQQEFFQLLRETPARIGMTCDSLELVNTVARELPNCEIHYDGLVDKANLEALKPYAEKLTVWLPYQCKRTSWVTVPFASEELCDLVKQYAALGIWIVDNYEDYDCIVKRFTPDIVETTGRIKPVINNNFRVDMHTHSEYSHDSQCPISDMAANQSAKGTNAFAVTDHCDVFAWQDTDVLTPIKNSVKQAKKLSGSTGVEILSGVEIGEGFWYSHITDQLLKQCEYDVVIGSVHTVKFKGSELPYSQIDFSAMDTEEIYEFLDLYFDDVATMLQQHSCDIMAHLTCPLRYINGKYQRGIDCRRFEEKIRRILQYIIDHAIAMEINTSGIHEAYNDFMPQEWIVQLYKELGGYLVTVGSDAHVAAKAANGFEEAYALLRKHGFRNVYYFKNRRCIQCSL